MRAVWQPLRNIHKTLHFHHFDEEQDVKESVRQVVKSAIENYRVYLTQLQTYFAQKKDLNAKFIDEKGNEKTYAEAILDRFNSVRFLTALRASALGVEELNREIALALRAENYFGSAKRMIGTSVSQL